MKYDDNNPAGFFISIAVLSAALLSFQIYLISLLSITQWYHFAYMVISIALLGFGSAGTFLSIFKDRMIKHNDILSYVLTILTALLISISVSLSQTDLFYFDSYKIFTDFSQILRLFAFYILFTAPFFFGALVIGLAFVKYTDRIGTLYFYNMAGSGFGALLFLLFADIFQTENIPQVISIIIIVGMFIPILNYKKGRVMILVSLIILSIPLLFLSSTTLIYSEYKGLSKILDLPGSEIIIKKNSVYGEISLINSPSVRYAPGLSLTYNNKVPVSNSTCINGNWAGPLIGSDSAYRQIFKSSTESLPYALSEREDVLCLKSGTGNIVKGAILQYADDIIAVEQNSALTDLLRNSYPELVDSVYNNHKVKLYNLTPRNFISYSDKKFDLIHLPIIDAFGGTSGVNALKTNYLLTKEAFTDMLDLLKGKGVICVSTFIDYPYNNVLKLFSIISEVLYDEGKNNPLNHIIAVKNWNSITIIMKREVFEDHEIESAKKFCGEFNFDPVILSGIRNIERDYYNKLSDTLFFSYIDEILKTPASREKLYRKYPFNISPPTDNNPFFSQFMKLTSLSEVAGIFGKGQIAFFEIGYILLYTTFIKTIAISILLILLPLIIWRLYKSSKLENRTDDSRSKLGSLLYFSGIGWGYIFLEIVFVQYFNLYLGNIIYSTSLVIALMLISSGLGSLYSHRIAVNRETIIPVFITIPLFLIISFIFLLTVIKSTLNYSIYLKILISLIIIFPISFLMGMPFPYGLKYLSIKNRDLIPWAWGINGIFSVIGVVVATIISVEIGQNWLIIFAAAAYFLSLVTQFKGKKNAPLLS